MLSIKGLSMTLPNGVLTLPDLNIDAGELLIITGTSGIGKSSLLHWLLGDSPDYVRGLGRCLLDDNDITEWPIEKRQIGLLMQDVYLFPHLTVADNIAFALPQNLRGQSRRRNKAHEALTSIDLAHLAKRYPEQLSGGERSRVGLLRALVNQPKAMLLDEPFSALDPNTRSAIRRWSYRQLGEANIPAVMVSHDPEDIEPDVQHLDLTPCYQSNEAL